MDWILVDFLFLLLRRPWPNNSLMIRSPSLRRRSASSTRMAMVDFFFISSFFFFLDYSWFDAVLSFVFFRSDCLFCCVGGVLCLI